MARNFKLNRDLSTRECAMRSFKITQEYFARDPGVMMGDVADALMSRLNICRATAYRQVRLAMDILAIPYDENAHLSRRAEKTACTNQDPEVRARISAAQKARWTDQRRAQASALATQRNREKGLSIHA